MEQQIADEQHRVRLLGAELAHLEAPERIERLSQQYLGLAPIDAKHETARRQPDGDRPPGRRRRRPPRRGPKPTPTPAPRQDRARHHNPNANLRVEGSGAGCGAAVSRIDSAISAIDFPDYREPYGPVQVWRWLAERMWSVERAFERSKTVRPGGGRHAAAHLLRAVDLRAGLRDPGPARHPRRPVRAGAGEAGHSAAALAGARADLTDRNGNLLAIDLTHYGLYLDPREIWDTDEIRRKLPAGLPQAVRSSGWTRRCTAVGANTWPAA